MSGQLPGVRAQLLRGAFAVVLVTVALFAGAAWFLVVRPAEDEAAAQQMRLAATQAGAPVASLLRVVDRVITISRDWGVNGLMSTDDYARFGRLFVPILNARSEMSAAILAREDGREIFLLKTPHGWDTRLSDPARHGRRQRWLAMDAAGGSSSERWRESDYDARTRPWFRGAMALPQDGGLYLTEPYRFYSSQRMGVTASTRWTERKTGRRHVIAFDVELRDLTQLSSSIRLGTHGSVAILSEDGRLLGLPLAPRGRSQNAIDAQLLQRPEQAGQTRFAAAWRAWEAAGRRTGETLRFEHDGATWFALFDPIAFGKRRFVVAAVAPAGDFAIAKAWHLAAIGAILAAALAAALLLSHFGARRLAAVLAALARESERIGGLELERPVAVDAHSRETAALAAAQERMRQALLEATRDLEAKIAARTRELTDTAAMRQTLIHEQHAIFESATAGIAMVQKGVIQQCNGRLEELFGYAPGGLLGEPIRAWYDDDAEYRADSAAIGAEMARGGTLHREEQMRRKDGSLFWGRLSGRAIEPSDLSRGSVWMLEDITDEHAAAEFLKDKTAFLETEVTKRTRQVSTIQDVTIMAMASLAETRDNETGNHIRRTQNYVRLLALELRRLGLHADALDDTAIDLLYKSAPLHDIGKVGIPDRILLKPGRLTPEEFEVMKTHTTLGRDAILAAEKLLDEPNSFLQYAREIAHYHQEKWDGSGYPEGLRGEQIPLAARLMAVADVYDALISRRVYKPAFPHDRSVAIIREGRGAHFDPQMVDAFLNVADAFQAIAGRYQDSEEEVAAKARPA